MGRSWKGRGPLVLEIVVVSAKLFERAFAHVVQ